MNNPTVCECCGLEAEGDSKVWQTSDETRHDFPVCQNCFILAGETVIGLSLGIENTKEFANSTFDFLQTLSENLLWWRERKEQNGQHNQQT